MTNSTAEDGNYTTWCTTGLFGTHQKIAMSVLNSFLAITALLGNALIIVALQKVSSLQPPSKLLFSCLAVTDLCVGLITQPLLVAFLTSAEHTERCRYLSIVSNIIMVIFGGVSLLTVTAISVDRLLALVLRLRYRQVVTLRRVQLFVLAFWICSLTVAVIFIFFFTVTILVICIFMLLCIVTFTVCYAKIYLKLCQHQSQVQDHVYQRQPNGGGIPLNIARYKKTVSSALWIQLTLMVCYLPYTIVALYGITRFRTEFIDLAWQAAISLVMLNSSLNPALYCWKMREVRQAVMDTIRQFGQFICSSS